MGCDIHLYIERKIIINNKQKWINIDYWKINPYCEDEGENKYDHVSVYSDRDYRLFSRLADVRNYNDNEVISQPRGLPLDVSPEVKQESDEWDGDGHSHSSIFLNELLEFQKKNQSEIHEGYMSKEDAKLVDQGEIPKYWCQATTIENYVYRKWESKDNSLNHLIESIINHLKKEFWINSIDDKPELLDEIRIVFWFDN